MTLARRGWLPIAIFACGALGAPACESDGGADAPATGGSGGVEEGAGTEDAGVGGGAGATTASGGASGAMAGGAAGAPGGAPAGGAAATGGAGGSVLPDEPFDVAQGLLRPTGLAVDDTRIYIAERDADRIVTCPLSGCAGAPTELVTETVAPISVAVSADRLYWVSGWKPSDTGAPQGRVVYECSLPDCDAASIQTFDSGSYQPYGVAFQSDRLYFAAWPNIGYCSTDGCAVEDVDLGSGSAVSIAPHGSETFVAMNGWQQVQVCGGTCSGTVLLDGVFPMSVVADDTHVYVSDYDFFGFGGSPDAGAGSRILRCPVEGCPASGPEVVDAGGIGPYALAVDSSRLYYSNHEAGTVVSLPK